MERQKTATKKAGKREDDDLFFHVVFIGIDKISKMARKLSKR